MKEIRAMMIGAHPDDCDFRCGGLALKYAQAGHRVKFLSMADGSCGHHRMKREEIAARRKSETEAVARLTGIEYEVWDVPDCELIADLATRKRLVREIRAFCPDVVFCCRPNDYHADHRNASILVQDASYLLIVPNFCDDVPAMKKTPVILYFYDHFRNPPFRADIVIGIDDVIERKFQMLDCHVSQMYEWLPYTKGTLDTVPSDPRERLEWLREPRLPRDGRPLDQSILSSNLIGSESEYREAVPAALFRDKLIERYGDKGREILFAEAFSVCEYGAPLDREKERWMFPF
ncbi:MAG: PIG-L deacetylase family protein [Christensenellales bacterium]|jgi:LmbE family N-acetylglucosaminyl deacetylase